MKSARSRNDCHQFLTITKSSEKWSIDPAQVLNIMNAALISAKLFASHTTFSYMKWIVTQANNHETATENTGPITLRDEKFVLSINPMILLNTLVILDLDAFQVRLEIMNGFEYFGNF